MEIEKEERTEVKLSFSIDNLLADKVNSASERNNSEVFDCEDVASDCSEQVDVEGSTVDAQEFMDMKNDYQQAGWSFALPTHR